MTDLKCDVGEDFGNGLGGCGPSGPGSRRIQRKRRGLRSTSSSLNDSKRVGHA